MILYKLVDQNRQTGHGYTLTTWRKGFRPPRLSGEGGLCTGGWYHAYEHPLLAVLHNPGHANIEDPRCYKIEVDEADAGRLDGQMKIGFTTCVTLEEIKLPKVTIEQKVRYAIGCGLMVWDNPEFVSWARKWLRAQDRSTAAVMAVWKAAAVVESFAVRAASTTRWGAVAMAAMEASAVRPLDLIRIAEWAMTDEPMETLLEVNDE